MQWEKTQQIREERIQSEQRISTKIKQGKKTVARHSLQKNEQLTKKERGEIKKVRSRLDESRVVESDELEIESQRGEEGVTGNRGKRTRTHW